MSRGTTKRAVVGKRKEREADDSEIESSLEVSGDGNLTVLDCMREIGFQLKRMNDDREESRRPGFCRKLFCCHYCYNRVFLVPACFILGCLFAMVLLGALRQFFHFYGLL